MATNNATYILSNVEALYPKINTCYRFDNSANGGKGRSVPCDPTDEGAKYEMSFRMSKQQAADLYKAMKQTYNEKKAANWPDMPKPGQVFTKDEDGMYVGKTTLKGAYGNEVTRPPRQFDASNNVLPDDFLLTTGSTVNGQVALIPYSMRENGVSLRLRAVQVVKYREMEMSSPFDSVDGGFEGGAKESFGDDFDSDPEEDVFAPAKVEAKPTKAEKPKAKAKEKASKVEDYDDIDDALDNLDFDD